MPRPNMDPPDESTLQNQTIAKIQQYLGTKDDTSRLVGLALLKSTLDSSPELQQDKEVLISLWNSISPKFLDRLLRMGFSEKSEKSRNMINIAVAVIYTFTMLLPDEERSTATRLHERIPRLVEAVINCSASETSELIFKTLLTLTTFPEGGRIFDELDDWSPLVEIAPKEPLALDVLASSWLNGAIIREYRPTLKEKVDKTIEALLRSYRGTDGITLLAFMARVLDTLSNDLLPREPNWLVPLVEFIRRLSTNRPSSTSRQAYTTCAAQLLINYPNQTPLVLFKDNPGSSKPFSYLFVNLILIDLRASVPSLLEKLNTPDYADISARLFGCLVILESFISYLLQQMEQMDDGSHDNDDFMYRFQITPDLILRLKQSMSDTLSVIIEYLRDRWDAAVAGAHGLHPDARIGQSHTVSGSHLTLSWDSKQDSAGQDPLILASLRVLAAWLPEDDGEILRKEAASLMDMLMETYSSSQKQLDGIAAETISGVTARIIVLGVLEGVTQTEDGITSFLEYGGWRELSRDLITLFQNSSDALELESGTQIVRILDNIAETERYTPEAWLDFATQLATCSVPETKFSLESQTMWADALLLAARLLERAPPGVKLRYVHTARAIVGMAETLKKRRGEGFNDVLNVLTSDPIFTA